MAGPRAAAAAAAAAAAVLLLVWGAAGAEEEAGASEDVCPSGGAGCAPEAAAAAAAAALPEVWEPGKPGVYPRYKEVPRHRGVRVWSAAELALHRGTDEKRPLLLAVVGEVYDVGTGAQYYGPGKGYHVFAGRDYSRNFADTDLELGEDEMSRVQDLPSEDFQGVLGWRSFYRDHASYVFVGFLEGRYFDAEGTPTHEHKFVEELYAAATASEDAKKSLQKRFKSCNSRHKQADAFFEIWCDDSWHGKGTVPVHIYYKPRQAGMKEASWCGCVAPRERRGLDAEAAQSGMLFRLVDYPECKGEQRCKRPKGAKSP